MTPPTAPPRPGLEDAPVVCDAPRSAELLDYPSLVQAIALAAAQFEAGEIRSPDRLVVPLGEGGVMLSMPATAADIGVHKLVNVQPGNRQRQLPTIHGLVTVCAADTGRPLCLLDGPQLTGRRTAAVSMLAMRELLAAPPDEVLLIGTGVQARHHVQALQALYPRCRIWVRGARAASAEAFCQDAGAAPQRLDVLAGPIPDAVQAVFTLTTSTEPVYDEPARRDRVVIGVGAFKPQMAEIGRTTLQGSQLHADDPAAARHEAGDLMRAGVDWSTVHSLAALLRDGADRRRPQVFKSVGTAAWDLAAARVALSHLNPRA